MPLTDETVLSLYPWEDDGASDEPLYEDSLVDIKRRAKSGDIEPRKYFAEDNSDICEEYVVEINSDGTLSVVKYLDA